MRNKECPLCGSNKYNVLDQFDETGFAEYGCRMVRCCLCGHYFYETRRDLDMERLYSCGQYTVIDNRGSLFDKILSIDDILIIRQLSKLKGSKGTLLDFGCGKGRFINLASKYGWKVKGIETAEERAEFGINKYGLDISTHQYQTGPINGAPFDAITLLHVLEHLSNPKELLGELVNNNLVSDGFLVIEVPLFGSLQSRVAGKRWMHLDPPFHISHFTKSTLLKLLGNLKLKPLKYEYFSIHLGILGMVQSVMSLFGYNKMIISELKFRRTCKLMIGTLSALPVASLLELFAICFGNGGIIRVYCKKHDS